MVDYEHIRKDLDDMKEILKRKFYIIIENINDKGIEFYREHITVNKNMSILTILPLSIIYHYDDDLNIIIDKIIQI